MPKCPQEVAQWLGTKPHEAKVTSSNPPFPPLVWTCQKKEKEMPKPRRG
jgi:hypothetical protein